MAIYGNTRPRGGTRNFSYDPDGNLTSDGIHTNSWDALNRPIQISDSGTNSTVQIAYTPGGARYQETTTSGSSSTTLTEVNALFQVEATSSYTYYREQIMGGAGIVAVRTIRSDGILTTRYLTSDHLGSVSVITDEAGNIDERMSYDAFGMRRNPTTWQDYFSLPDLTDITDKGYTDQQQMDAVGLVHMNGRVYDPVVGRFMSADPTVPDPLDGQSFNRYAYVENNPLSAVDPSGFCSQMSMGNCPNAPNTTPVEVCFSACSAATTLDPITPLNDDVVDQAATTYIAPPPTVPPTDTTTSSAPLPIPTGSGNNGSSGFGNNNSAGPGSGNFLQTPVTPCQYGSNCGGNNGVQQAMNDTNGVQNVSFGDIDWGSMGSGKLRGPPDREGIPNPNTPIGGGPTVGAPKAPGSVGVTVPWANPTGGKIRGCDKDWGCGYFHAPRSTGPIQRLHEGADYIATPGQDVAAVTSGEITKIGYPYADDLHYRYIKIVTSAGYIIREMYVSPANTIRPGVNVTAGEIIGHQQDLEGRYPGITNHVHIDIQFHGIFVDPTTLIPPE